MKTRKIKSIRPSNKYLLLLSLIPLLAAPYYEAGADSPLTGIKAPITKPKRRLDQRARLVDGLSASSGARSWRGKPGRNTFTVELPRSVKLSRAVLNFQKAADIKKAVLLAGDSVPFLELQAQKRKVKTDASRSIELRGLGKKVSVLRVVLQTKRKGKRKRLSPSVLELTVYEETSSSPAPSPSATATPSASSSPSPSASASPSSSPSNSPSPSPSPLLINQVENGSLNSLAQQGAGDSQRPSLSDDGRYLAFTTIPNGFLAGSSFNSRSVFLRDLQTGSTILVSKGSTGNPLFASDPDISGDGRFITYSARPSGLVNQVFRYDRVLDQTILVSSSALGVASSGSCAEPSINENGDEIAFLCFDSNLDPRDNNSKLDVYKKTISSGAIELVSVNSAGQIANEDAQKPSISGDGAIVVWDSRADNLISSDTNATSDVFARDFNQNSTFLVSESVSGIQGNDESDVAEISRDGRYVAFQTFAQNLVAGPAGMRGVVRKDLQTGEMYYISAKSDGSQPNGDNYFPSLSADGRYVIFESDAPDLITGDQGGFIDCFLHDSLTGETILLSQSVTGQQGDGSSSQDMGAIKSLAASSLTAAFSTQATNLFSPDSNFRMDIAVVRLSR